MKQEKLAELTDEELLQEAKKTKSTTIYDSLIFGVLIGIAIYGSVKNGLGFITFIPLIYIPIAAKNKTKNKELQKLLKERNLKQDNVVRDDIYEEIITKTEHVQVIKFRGIDFKSRIRVICKEGWLQ